MMGRVCVATEGEQGVFGLKGNVTSELETDLLRGNLTYERCFVLKRDWLDAAAAAGIQNGCGAGSVSSCANTIIVSEINMQHLLIRDGVLNLWKRKSAGWPT